MYYTRNPALRQPLFLLSKCKFSISFPRLFPVFPRYLVVPAPSSPLCPQNTLRRPRFPPRIFGEITIFPSPSPASLCQIRDLDGSSPVFPQKMLRFTKRRCIILRQHEHLLFWERFPLICGDPPFEPPPGASDGFLYLKEKRPESTKKRRSAAMIAHVGHGMTAPRA